MPVLARVHGLRVREVPIPGIYAGEKSHRNAVRCGLDVPGVVWDYERGRHHGMQPGLRPG